MLTIGQKLSDFVSLSHLNVEIKKTWPDEISLIHNRSIPGYFEIERTFNSTILNYTSSLGYILLSSYIISIRLFVYINIIRFNN